jgi:hypothetical protein
MPLPKAPYHEKGQSSIDYFKNNFLSRGLSKPTRYSILIESDNWSNPQIFQPEQISLPGRTFKTIEEQWFGPPRKIPVAREFNSDVIMTFPVSSDWAERSFFEEWMDLIVDPNYNDTLYSSDGHSVHGTLTIYCTNESDKTQSIFKFDEVYPLSIIPMNLGFASQNTYNRIQVIFAFRQYTYEAKEYTNDFGAY